MTYRIERVKQRYEEEINKNIKDTDGNWRSIKDTIRNTAKKVLTTAKMEARKPCMTLNIIKERNKLEKVSAVNEYKELSRIIQKKCREAKTKYINEQCRIIEELEERYDHTKMYQTVRRMQRKKILKKSKNILNKDGKILEGNEEQGNRWKEYMNELYEGQKLNSNENILVDETDTIIDYEIDIAINKLRNNKATETDKIPIELIRYGGETLKKEIRSITKKAYDSGKIDEDFLRTEFIAISKKNGTMKCEEQRTIALTSHTSKILYATVLNKIAPILNSQINKLQYGFIPNRGILEATTVLKSMTTSRLNQQKDTYIGFIDFEKAFDKVDHEKLLKIIENRGVNGKCLRIFKNLYAGQKAHMRDHEDKTIEVRRGVRQGCVLSPILYNTYADEVLKDLSIDKGIIIGGKKINRIMYADDTAIISDSETTLKNLMEEVERRAKAYNINLNIRKTKCTRINWKGIKELNAQVNNNEIESVKNFKYLGVNIECTGRDTDEIQQRIGIARKAFWNCRDIMRNDLRLKTKRRLLRTYVWPVAKYGSELWELTQKTKNKIRAFEIWCYRRILKI